MSDPVQPAAAPAATAPVVDATPAPEVAAAPPGPAPKRHPYAAKPVVRPVAAASPAAPAADAKPVATPKGSRVLAMRERELAALRTEVEPLKAARTEYEALLAPIVERELATLPEKARAAITKKHGKDAAAALREISYLRDLGAFAAPAPAGPPATTAPKAAATAAPVEADDDLSHYRAHAKLVEGGQPMRAATYLAQHYASISRGRQKAQRAS